MVSILCAAFGVFWLVILIWMLALPIPPIGKAMAASAGIGGFGLIVSVWRWSIAASRGTDAADSARFWWRAAFVCWGAMLLVLLTSAVAARSGLFGPLAR